MTQNHGLAKLSVLITGAASGIGRKLAFYLHEEGVGRLILVDRSIEELDEFVLSLGPDSASGISTHCVDISKQGDITKLCKEIRNFPVDVLVNNAGVFYSGSFAKMKTSDFMEMVNVNLMGTVRLCHAMLAKLTESSEGGRIINLASAAGLIGAPGMCAYSTTKFAIVGFSQALRAELDGQIPVSVVCPTFVKTNIAKNAVMDADLDDDDREKQSLEMHDFIQKVGCSPTKVAKIIVETMFNGKEMVLVNPDTHALYYINKFMPKVSRGIISKAYKVLLNKGVINT